MLTMLDLETEEGKRSVEYLVQLELYRFASAQKGNDYLLEHQDTVDDEQKEAVADFLEMVNEALLDAERYHAIVMAKLNHLIAQITELPFYSQVSERMAALQPMMQATIYASILDKIKSVINVTAITVLPSDDEAIVRPNPSGAHSFGFLQQLVPKIKSVEGLSALEYRIDWDSSGMLLTISDQTRIESLLHEKDRKTERTRFRNEVAPKIAAALMKYSSADVQINPSDVARRTARQMFSLVDNFRRAETSTSQQSNDLSLPLITAEAGFRLEN